MNRLTKTYLDGTYGVADILPCGENSYDFKNLLIKTLGKYEDLEEQGLLIKLPCKLGTKVYVVDNDFDGCTLKIYETSYNLGLYEYGAKIFLTREEAEKALSQQSRSLKKY